MKRLFSIGAILAVASATVSAQAKPSFAGKWTLVPPPPGARGGGGAGLAREFTATQDETTLTVTTVNTRAGETKTVYNLDGSETKNLLTLNGTTIVRLSRAKWNKSKLVLTTRTNFPGNATEAEQIWVLDASGNLIVESTTRSYVTVARADPDRIKDTIDAALAHERPRPGSIADDASTTLKATYRKN